MVARIVPASVAHSVSAAQPCRSEHRFEGDEVAAKCRLNLGDHINREHEDTTRTRRWVTNSRGRVIAASMKPASEPLRREYRPTSHDEQALLDAASGGAR